VCRALVASDEPALGSLQSVTFRLGERRLVVRPVKGTPGRFSVLVAAGEAVDRPGLAHRQLERAAGLLRGVWERAPCRSSITRRRRSTSRSSTTAPAWRARRQACSTCTARSPTGTRGR